MTRIIDNRQGHRHTLSRRLRRIRNHHGHSLTALNRVLRQAGTQQNLLTAREQGSNMTVRAHAQQGDVKDRCGPLAATATAASAAASATTGGFGSLSSPSVKFVQGGLFDGLFGCGRTATAATTTTAAGAAVLVTCAATVTASQRQFGCALGHLHAHSRCRTGVVAHLKGVVLSGSLKAGENIGRTHAVHIAHDQTVRQQGSEQHLNSLTVITFGATLGHVTLIGEPEVHAGPVDILHALVLSPRLQGGDTHGAAGQRNVGDRALREHVLNDVEDAGHGVRCESVAGRVRHQGGGGCAHVLNLRHRKPPGILRGPACLQAGRCHRRG